MKKISCMSAADAAWRKMVAMLFQPFNFAKWITLGFCAWLAGPGEGWGGANFDYLFNDNDWKALSRRGNGSAFFKALDEIFNGVSGNIFTRTAEQCHISVNLLAAIGCGLAVAALAAIALSLALLWLKSRFGFIWLDNLVYDRTDIIGPWKKFKTCGNSAFWWRLVFGIAVATLWIVLTGFSCIWLCPWFKSMLAAKSLLPPDGAAITGMIISGTLALLLTMLALLVSFLFEQLVAPAMYWGELRALEAWRKILSLLKNNVAVFVRYGALYLVFSMIAGAAALIGCLATCCIGFILLLIPFVGTALLLPVAVFFRLFGIELLAQFGPEYNIPLPPAETTATDARPAAH